MVVVREPFMRLEICCHRLQPAATSQAATVTAQVDFIRKYMWNKSCPFTQIFTWILFNRFPINSTEQNSHFLAWHFKSSMICLPLFLLPNISFTCLIFQSKWIKPCIFFFCFHIFAHARNFLPNHLLFILHKTQLSLQNFGLNNLPSLQTSPSRLNS